MPTRHDASVMLAAVQWQILEQLDDAERRDVLRSARRRRFRNSETIFHQGDPGVSLHLIERGHVAVRMFDRRGSMTTFDLLPPGGYVGEMSLVGKNPFRSASAVAVGPVETMALSREVFDSLCDRHPSVMGVLAEMLTERVEWLSEQVMDAHSLHADERVVKQLVRLARNFAGQGEVVIPITQEGLASLAGTTRPTANRAIRSLVADGTIEIRRGRIVIRDARVLGASVPPGDRPSLVADIAGGG